MKTKDQCLRWRVELHMDTCGDLFCSKEYGKGAEIWRHWSLSMYWQVRETTHNTVLLGDKMTAEIQCNGINTHKENLKYAYCAVVRGCYFSEKRFWCDCGQISWNITALSSRMDRKQKVRNYLERKRAKQQASVISLCTCKSLVSANLGVT